MKDYGAQSMVSPLCRVLVRRPDAAFGSADPQRWHYSAAIELETAQGQHDVLVGLLEDSGVEICRHEARLPQHADAIFVHDPVLVTDSGALILSMGKKLRRGEEDAMLSAMEAHRVPVFGRLEGSACAEGGDLLWLDEHSLAVGRGFRTNAEGLRQITAVMKTLGVGVIPVHLPFAGGPVACLHLMSLISMLDDDLAVAFPPLMPVPFLEELAERGIELVEVPEGEFKTMATNVLAVAPRDLIMLEGNPITRQRLEDRGCRVRTYPGSELSLKAEGGATCLTRPLLRRC